ncbi:MAG: molybdopterin molybdotransferase MoeA [Desulfobacteraceae bacterium]|nr:molybdopterin molybdotransferase MoeA [Desulfobacteraceae bacterium]
MSKEFFTVTPVREVFERIAEFPRVGAETVSITQAGTRVLAENIVADIDVPGFARATMDGYAVRASATFGASESNPAYLTICGKVDMGDIPTLKIGHAQTARIATGGMLPPGADAVVMMEQTTEIDEATLEVYKAVAPGTNTVAADEDFAKNREVLAADTPLRPQEIGLLAALGRKEIRVYQKPVIGIISTGDELVEVDQVPPPGRIRDVNTYTLSAMAANAGGLPRTYGIVADQYEHLLSVCRRALAETDMVLISGGSSVGTRDLTMEVIESLPESQIMFHGIPVRPGKPTILAKSGEKALWGLPGQITSAMVVFDRIVAPFVRHIGGNARCLRQSYRISAVLTRNLPSVQGRTDYIRTRIAEKDGQYHAEPILGPSGLIRTMVEADGLIEIDMNTEGLEQGETVSVIPLR